MTPLSEAIKLGMEIPPATIVTMSAPLLRIPNFSNAMLLACCATGIQMKYSAVLNKWPWLRTKMISPCRCSNLVTPNGLLVLLHLVDSHQYTPEQLRTFIVSHESELGSLALQ